MKKISLFMAVLFLGAAFLAANVRAAETPDGRWSKEYSVDELQGTIVKNQQGERLGDIHDIIVDSEGRASFAVVALGAATWGVYPLGSEWLWTLGVGDKMVAVPFASLNLAGEPGGAVLNATRDQLESAPVYQAGRLSDTRWAESVYRFFGQQPTWKE